MEQVIETPLANAGRMRRVLRIVGGLSLVSNAMGAIDYTMTQTRNATWLAAATPEQRSYIDHFPTLMVAFWALGVGGGVRYIHPAADLPPACRDGVRGVGGRNRGGDCLSVAGLAGAGGSKRG